MITEGPIMQTAILEAQSKARLADAMDRLLHALKRYMQSCPMRSDANMPEHDLMWVTECDGGPGRVILDAMKATPELWMQGLPQEVCLVTRKTLQTVTGLNADVIGMLAAEGAYMVDVCAARHRQGEDGSNSR